jgi:phosphatidylinositol 3-kinase
MEDRDLIWKFRFWLRSNPKALTKFVRSVNWQEKQEVRQAIQVIMYAGNLVELIFII